MSEYKFMKRLEAERQVTRIAHQPWLAELGQKLRIYSR